MLFYGDRSLNVDIGKSLPEGALTRAPENSLTTDCLGCFASPHAETSSKIPRSAKWLEDAWTTLVNGFPVLLAVLPEWFWIGTHIVTVMDRKGRDSMV